MGWRDRDYAKWTDEERRRFYGSGSPHAGSSPLDGYGSPRPATRTGLFRPGVGAAILVSVAVFALGHVPRSHPLVPLLHFRMPGLNSASAPAVIRPTGTINTPGTASVGSTLTFHGTAPPGNGPVTVEGSYDGGQTWQILSSVNSVGGSYAAEITLRQRGLLQIQILFSDGSKAVGAVNVE